MFFLVIPRFHEDKFITPLIPLFLSGIFMHPLRLCGEDGT